MTQSKKFVLGYEISDAVEFALLYAERKEMDKAIEMCDSARDIGNLNACEYYHLALIYVNNEMLEDTLDTLSYGIHLLPYKKNDEDLFLERSLYAQLGCTQYFLSELGSGDYYNETYMNLKFAITGSLPADVATKCGMVLIETCLIVDDLDLAQELINNYSTGKLNEFVKRYGFSEDLEIAQETINLILGIDSGEFLETIGNQYIN